MIDVKSKKCKFEGCIKQCSFGIKGDKIATYCRIHKKDNMINVRYKKCKSLF